MKYLTDRPILSARIALAVTMIGVIVTILLVVFTGKASAQEDDRTVYISHERAHRLWSQGLKPECRYEDGSGQRRTCVWDARHMGNGKGRSFLSITPR